MSVYVKIAASKVGMPVGGNWSCNELHCRSECERWMHGNGGCMMSSGGVPTVGSAMFMFHVHCCRPLAYTFLGSAQCTVIIHLRQTMVNNPVLSFSHGIRFAAAETTKHIVLLSSVHRNNSLPTAVQYPRDHSNRTPLHAYMFWTFKTIYSASVIGFASTS